MSDEPLVTKSSDILSGIPVFYGTRVPVQNLLDYLAGGDTIDEFLDDFPSVRHDQVVRFLERMGAATIALSDENTA